MSPFDSYWCHSCLDPFCANCFKRSSFEFCWSFCFIIFCFSVFCPFNYCFFSLHFFCTHSLPLQYLELNTKHIVILSIKVRFFLIALAQLHMFLYDSDTNSDVCFFFFPHCRATFHRLWAKSPKTGPSSPFHMLMASPSCYTCF